jgi:proteasome lid subunit RPN8/RPN11
MKKVSIKREAFNSILASGILAYRREVYGLITGTNSGVSVVNSAFYCSEGDFTKIESEKSMRKYKNLCNSLSSKSLSIIGDFHSHTSPLTHFPQTQPSPEDIEDMKENPDWIYFILSLKKQKKKSVKKIRRSIKGGVYGSLGNFYFHLCAFQLNQERRRHYDTLEIIL